MNDPVSDTDLAAFRRRARIALIRHFWRAGRVGWQLHLIRRSAPPRGKRALFRATDRRGNSVIVKVYEDRERASRVFHNASEIGRLSRHSVQPLFSGPRMGVVGFEDLGETSLASMLGDGDRPALIAGVARWMADLHGDCTMGMSTPTQALKEDLLSLRLRDCTRFARDPRVVTILPMVDASLAQTADACWPIARLQADCHPANLMVAPRGLVAIDRPRSRIGPVEEDIAHFLIEFGIHFVGLRDLDFLGRARDIMAETYGLNASGTRAARSAAGAAGAGGMDASRAPTRWHAQAKAEGRSLAGPDRGRTAGAGGSLTYRPRRKTVAP